MRSRNLARPAIIALCLVGTIATGLLLALWSQHPSKDTLEYEAAKTCLQVIGLVVLGGVVALATSRVETARQDEALEHQEREESFKIRAELLDRTARCAAQMYVTCRHVERLQANGAAGDPAQSRHAALLAAPALLDERFLTFSAEGLTVQTEIEARFETRHTLVEVAGVEKGEASLRWHQVYDLLTVYYFSLTGAFPPELLTNTSRTPDRFHSGLGLVPTVADVLAPTADELAELRRVVRTSYVETMPMLAAALLSEQLMTPTRT
jgi:hypothetical protein